MTGLSPFIWYVYYWFQMNSCEDRVSVTRPSKQHLFCLLILRLTKYQNHGNSCALILYLFMITDQDATMIWCDDRNINVALYVNMLELCVHVCYPYQCFSNKQYSIFFKNGWMKLLIWKSIIHFRSWFWWICVSVTLDLIFLFLGFSLCMSLFLIKF